MDWFFVGYPLLMDLKDLFNLCYSYLPILGPSLLLSGQIYRIELLFYSYYLTDPSESFYPLSKVVVLAERYLTFLDPWSNSYYQRIAIWACRDFPQHHYYSTMISIHKDCWCICMILGQQTRSHAWNLLDSCLVVCMFLMIWCSVSRANYHLRHELQWLLV